MIQQMVEDAIRIIERDEAADQITVSTGNVLVLAYRIHEEDGDGIHVVVASDYKEHYIDNKVLCK